MNDGTTQFRFAIGEEDVGLRLDVFLAEQDDPPLSRSQVKKYIDAGEIEVNDDIVKAGYRLREGDQIRWIYQAPPQPSTRPQDIDLQILYEDAELAIIDKPAGLVVHPAPGHPDQTLVNALTFHFSSLSSIGKERMRPGIVHRLDKDTSGALAIAKTDRAHRHLAIQFKNHAIERVYHALVFGPALPDAGTFRTGHARHPTHRLRFTGDIDSTRRAITHYRVLERFDSGAVLVACRLETGRTHQIRLHFSEAHAPLLSDRLYGGPATSEIPLIDRQALHARVLGLEGPDGQSIRVESEYPEDFAAALEALRAGKDWRS